MNLPEWASYLKGLNGHNLLLVAKTLDGVTELLSHPTEKFKTLQVLVDAFFEEAASKETEGESKRREVQGQHPTPLCPLCKHFIGKIGNPDNKNLRYIDGTCKKGCGIMAIECTDFEPIREIK